MPLFADRSSTRRLRRSCGRSQRVRRADRRGQTLVEFAIVALAIYLLFAAIVTFGSMLFSAQTVQQAVDYAAREISRTPLPYDATFDEVVRPDINDPTNEIARRVYSEDYLAIDLAAQAPGQSLLDFLDTLNPRVPPVNRLLLSLMFVSQVEGRPLLRYPGALVTSTTAPSGFTVKIPIVNSRDAAATETITWAHVIEPIDDDEDWFSVDSPERGVVALRINYPYQSPVMSGFAPAASEAERFEPSITRPIRANDTAVSAPPLSDGQSPVAPDPLGAGLYAGTYGGQYGLGEQGALNSPQLAAGEPLRPFRRVISVEAIYRREVFSR
jgi:hypothetical protein